MRGFLFRISLRRDLVNLLTQLNVPELLQTASFRRKQRAIQLLQKWWRWKRLHKNIDTLAALIFIQRWYRGCVSRQKIILMRLKSYGPPAMFFMPRDKRHVVHAAMVALNAQDRVWI